MPSAVNGASLLSQRANKPTIDARKCAVHLHLHLHLRAVAVIPEGRSLLCLVNCVGSEVTRVAKMNKQINY